MDEVKGLNIVEGSVVEGKTDRETEQSHLLTPWEENGGEVCGHPEPPEPGYHTGGTPKNYHGLNKNRNNCGEFPASAETSALHTCPREFSWIYLITDSHKDVVQGHQSQNSDSDVTLGGGGEGVSHNTLMETIPHQRIKWDSGFSKPLIQNKY